MRPILLAPLAACVVLAGCAGFGRDDSADQKPRTVGAIPAGYEDGATQQAKSEKDKRATASAVSIDTSVPPLPDDVGLRTTDVQLGTAALLVAQSEKDAGALGDRTIADRHAQIYAAWRPQMLERQAFLRQIEDERKRESQRQIAEAGRVARHEAEMRETDAKLEREVEAERRKHVAILTRDDRAIIE